MLVSVAVAPARADVTAMLPLVASADAESSRALVDAALRGELRRLDGVVLQPQADTERHVSGAAALGIECDPKDTTCAAQLAALCGVPLAVRGHLTRRRGELYLELVRFQVPSGAPLAISSGEIDNADVVAGTRMAVETLYGLRVEEPLPVEAPAPARPEGIARRQLPQPTILPFLLWTAGGSVASLGALTMGIGGVVGLSTMGLGTDPLASGETVKQRRDAIGLAQGATATLWIVGGTMFAAGAGLVTAGFLMPMVVE